MREEGHGLVLDKTINRYHLRGERQSNLVTSWRVCAIFLVLLLVQLSVSRLSLTLQTW